jgi:hypothetical protein
MSTDSSIAILEYSSTMVVLPLLAGGRMVEIGLSTRANCAPALVLLSLLLMHSSFALIIQDEVPQTEQEAQFLKRLEELQEEAPPEVGDHRDHCHHGDHSNDTLESAAASEGTAAATVTTQKPTDASTAAAHTSSAPFRDAAPSVAAAVVPGGHARESPSTKDWQSGASLGEFLRKQAQGDGE